MDASELKENMEKVAKGVADVQKLHKEDARKNAEQIENLKEEIKKSHEPVIEQDAQLKAQAAALKANQDAIETLTKAINENGSKAEANNEEYEQAMAHWMKTGKPADEELMRKSAEDLVARSTFGLDQSGIENVAQKDLLAGSAPDGGFFLSTDRSSSVSMRVFETSPVRSVANIVTTTADVWETILDDDEPASGWVGEVQARPKTDSAQVALIKIPVHEQYAMPQASQKILDDAGFDIAGWHQRKTADKFSRLENTAFVSGDGSAKPKGFLSYAAWAAAGTYQRDAIEQVETATAVTVAGDDLLELQGSLIENYQPNAVWMMRRAVLFNNIYTLADSAGNYLYNPVMIRDGAPLQLLGKPVVLASDMPAIANNSLSIAYGDFREGYTVVDRLGIRVLRDPLTTKPYVKFYTTKRVGGAVTNYEAIKLLKIKST